ncbi:hypothetical protein ILYODFUR_031022 [Ilyodon furcidens]|uniref:Secreted protein n=1 Tax=Ilyodon furcidens TaxID=33524 RepID=A0ABV0VK39_9TELE
MTFCCLHSLWWGSMAVFWTSVKSAVIHLILAYWSTVRDHFEQRWATTVLEGQRFPTYRCVLGPADLNHMAELPLQYAVTFCTGLAMSHIFHSGVLNQTNIF